jgi:hypothetical protein
VEIQIRWSDMLCRRRRSGMGIVSTTAVISRAGAKEVLGDILLAADHRGGRGRDLRLRCDRATDEPRQRPRRVHTDLSWPDRPDCSASAWQLHFIYLVELPAELGRPAALADQQRWAVFRAILDLSIYDGATEPDHRHRRDQR